MKELEKRWYFYKARQSLLSLNALGFAVMLSLGSYYTYLKADVIKNLLNKNVLIAETKSKVSKEVVVEPLLIAKAKTTIEKPIKATNVKEVVITSNNEGLKSSLYEVALEPVIPIINMEKESHKSSSKKRYRSTTHEEKSQRKMVKAKKSTYLTASELLTIRDEISKKDLHALNTETIKKIKLNGSSANYIETMKHKFSLTKKPREALLLAKAFYAKRDYVNAEKWALTANKLDSTKDESWHIFAKSKAKLGQKNEALRILSSYYKKSHSSKTKALMVKIKTERL